MNLPTGMSPNTALYYNHVVKQMQAHLNQSGHQHHHHHLQPAHGHVHQHQSAFGPVFGTHASPPFTHFHPGMDDEFGVMGRQFLRSLFAR